MKNHQWRWRLEKKHHHSIVWRKKPLNTSNMEVLWKYITVLMLQLFPHAEVRSSHVYSLGPDIHIMKTQIDHHYRKIFCNLLFSIRRKLWNNLFLTTCIEWSQSGKYFENFLLLHIKLQAQFHPRRVIQWKYENFKTKKIYFQAWIIFSEYCMDIDIFSSTYKI